MLDNYFNISVISEWTAFIASLFLLNRKSGVWRLFQVFLLITIIIETIAWYKRYHLDQPDINWLFNILLLISGPFLIGVLSKAKQFDRIRRLIWIVTVIFFVASICNLLFGQGVHVFNTYTEVTKDILFTVLSFYFFITILKEAEYTNLVRYPYFWLAVGLLFFGLGNNVLFLFLESFVRLYREEGINLFKVVLNTVNILFYGSLIASFVCCRAISK